MLKRKAGEALPDGNADKEALSVKFRHALRNVAAVTRNPILTTDGNNRVPTGGKQLSIALRGKDPRRAHLVTKASDRTTDDKLVLRTDDYAKMGISLHELLQITDAAHCAQKKAAAEANEKCQLEALKQHMEGPHPTVAGAAACLEKTVQEPCPRLAASARELKAYLALAETVKGMLDCPICKGPIDAPVLTPCCGQPMCRGCLGQSLDSQRELHGHSTCPCCRSALDPGQAAPCRILRQLRTAVEEIPTPE